MRYLVVPLQKVKSGEVALVQKTVRCETSSWGCRSGTAVISRENHKQPDGEDSCLEGADFNWIGAIMMDWCHHVPIHPFWGGYIGL